MQDFNSLNVSRVYLDDIDERDLINWRELQLSNLEAELTAHLERGK
jgi:hypothetical protein